MVGGTRGQPEPGTSAACPFPKPPADARGATPFGCGRRPRWAPRRAGALVRAARDGDRGAFAELVRVYQDVALLGDRHLAEDMAREAFVDAYLQLSALREPLAFPARFSAV